MNENNVRKTEFDKLEDWEKDLLIRLKKSPVKKTEIIDIINSKKRRAEAILYDLSTISGWPIWEDDGMVGVL